MTDMDAPTTLEPAACSAVSRVLREPLPGTATEAAKWLLLEQPGPWGRSAFTESRLDPEVGRRLTSLCDDHGYRAQVVRRPGERSTRTCFLIDASSATMRRVDLGDSREVLDLDLDRDGSALEGPLFAVCTNARRDACCAVHGNAAVRALAEAHAESTWETSHVGGHRFAANLLCFPHGYLFGRLRADTVRAVADGYAAGHVDLAHLRGRTSLSAPAQAAEWFVRREVGLQGVDDVLLESIDSRGPVHAIAMRAAGLRWNLEISGREATAPRIESCGADELVRPMTYELTAINAQPVP